ncbi:Flagellar protein FliO [Arthrobacter sp. SO5]|uniref:flagellar biosynthetic protein FliO n=1 Tax=Arthrobacter sp. SO5 TaxID=1897055 RepID=UPI001E381E3E|nr:flagellar biosynthetic protein FliO [Arthrobacter sp. SO5]MCB5273753.1 Flagellar protein FliO [Arthrobacter sp. SO5]
MDSLILGLRVLVALGAVLGLMWVLQRRLGKGTGRRRADRALTVVSRQSVGQKASVVVVDAAGQRFLLGVTDHTVNVLHTGEIPPETEDASAPESRRGAGEFARILSGFGPLSGGRNSFEADTPDASGKATGEPGNGAGESAGAASDGVPLSRRSTLHRDPHPRGPATRQGSGHPPMHGSILAGSTWKQAAAALRSGRRN